LFAASLGPEDWVAFEVSGNAAEIARILEPHVARVVVVSPSDTGIRQARAKTDWLDARTLARLLAAGSLEAVWMADERTRVMRRRLARRAQLVAARSRCKNEIHAVLIRRLIARPKVSDLFGLAGRRWLSKLELPVEERESVDAGMRLIEFLERELADVDRLIALDALGWAQVKRLMSVPGVNVICAASFLAAVGEIDRFKHPRKLVGYLGLDPGSASQGPDRARAATSPNRDPPRRAGRWSRHPGARCANPVRCARSTSACAPVAATRSRSSPRLASSRACSGSY
jgi:transposase